MLLMLGTGDAVNCADNCHNRNRRVQVKVQCLDFYIGENYILPLDI